ARTVLPVLLACGRVRRLVWRPGARSAGHVSFGPDCRLLPLLAPVLLGDGPADRPDRDSALRCPGGLPQFPGREVSAAWSGGAGRGADRRAATGQRTVDAGGCRPPGGRAGAAGERGEAPPPV